jgi:hypothetical protein
VRPVVTKAEAHMSLLNIDDDDDATPATSLDSVPAPSGDGPSHITIELECDLTDAEMQDRGEQMAADERAVERLKLRRKALNSDIRGKLDHMTVLAIAIDSRKEVRDVPCTWRPDYARKQWDLVRDDTERVIRTRAMSKLDLQTKLPLESAPQLEAAADTADDIDGGDGDHAPDDDDDVIGHPIDDDSGDFGDYDIDGNRIDGINRAANAEAYDAAMLAAAQPANNNVRLLPARSTPEDAAAMSKHARPTKPAKRGAKTKTSSKNGRKAR